MSNAAYIKQVNQICQELGSEYSTTTAIDQGYNIYRDLGNGYEFEISILESTRRKFNANIYVWRDKFRTIDEVRSIHSVSSLADRLAELTFKYTQN